ncbi:Na+/H+ antiporter [Dactylosporangium sp. AC04546]|uniref:Na+/H+ antiporter n=1 Tax=Dactylosporangium sp. AC04546 TaxID=2862460 RepID=UPI001EDFF62F|nr:Na+/H+ antiporter [Dactylosporangium sp. AC04546]WVK89299.1 Na+/H+ antiporter [Dactylosporangium sp. AC04546]
MNGAAFSLLALLLAAIGLVALSHRIAVPYPILLVLGGMAIGFVPGMTGVDLSPEVVLQVFLPPLLYYAGYYTTPRDLRAHGIAIALLCLVLVLVTAAAVAVVAHTVGGLPWPVAATLGAIVSPTDPVAAAAIATRLGVPRRVITVLEGEGLFNDATALALFKVTVAAVVAGSFSVGHAVQLFTVGTVGGIVAGVAVGWFVAFLRGRSTDPIIGVSVTIFGAYAAYHAAEHFGFSGVLGSLLCGLYCGWKIPQVATPASRLLGKPVWQMIVYLLTGALFLLLGLQLRPMLAELTGYRAIDVVAVAALVAAVVMVTRFAWLFLVPHVLTRPERAVVAWGGMRGAVSLAIALALPTSVASGEPFPDREVVVLTTFGVVLLTLVVPGLTLPMLIRVAGVGRAGGATSEAEEESRARLVLAEEALAHLERLVLRDGLDEGTIERLEDVYRYRRRELASEAGELRDPDHAHRMAVERAASLELVEVQRQVLLRMRREGQLGTEALHHIQRELDLQHAMLVPSDGGGQRVEGR